MTATEERLNRENQSLREELGLMNNRLAEMDRKHNQQLEELTQAHTLQMQQQAQQMAQLQEMMRQMSAQMQMQTQYLSPERKQPPAKKTNTQTTPQSKSLAGNLFNTARNLGQQFSEVVAPTASVPAPDNDEPTLPPDVGQQEHV